MKFTAICAMLITVIDCIEKVLGTERQVLFSADYVWAWWVFAAIWLFNALGMCFAKVSFK